MRVLLCEDDDLIARAMHRALSRAGYDVQRAAGIAEAVAALRERTPDIALVDMSLPDGDGSTLVARLREHPTIGIVIVSARDREQDRVIGLRTGADDYVVKPFSLAELLARIDALARRTRQLRSARPPEQALLGYGDIVLDVDARLVVTQDDRRIQLTTKESEVLRLLISGAGTVVRRETLLDRVWASNGESGSRTLDTHIATLRTKLGDCARITTVRGRGYRLGGHV